MAEETFFGFDKVDIGSGIQESHSANKNYVDNRSGLNITLQQNQLRLIPAEVCWGLLKAAAFWTLLSGLSQTYLILLPSYPLADSMGRLFNTDGEQSFPAVYSTLLLLVSAIVLFWISNSSGLTTPRQARDWRLLSWIFFCLSLDELMSIHEILITPLRQVLGVSGIWHYAWVIPALVLVSLFFLKFFRFWLGLPPSVRFLFALAAILFVGGAVGVEMLSAQYISSAQEDGLYIIITHVEEFFEMAGISVFLSGLLQSICLKTKQSTLNLHLMASMLTLTQDTSPLKDKGNAEF